MELPKSSELREKKGYEGIAIVIGILSLIAASIGIFFQFRAEKKRELTCSVVSNTELTSVSSVPGLFSKFTYNNKPVAHLWKVGLNCENTGNDTLIGEGPHNNLMGDGLLFGFPAESEILNFEMARNDPAIRIGVVESNRIEIAPGASPSAVLAPNQFKLGFAQWRPAEKVNTSFYIASEKPVAAPLLPAAPARDVVDGTVVILTP